VTRYINRVRFILFGVFRFDILLDAVTYYPYTKRTPPGALLEHGTEWG